MIRYVIRRIILLIPVILAVSLFVFILMDLAPGDKLATLLIGGAELSAEEIAALRTQFGYDRTVFYRYGRYMLNLLQGDLGVSDVTGIPVWGLFLERLPYTLALSAGALVVGVGVSIPMGVRAARRAGKLTDNATTTFTLIGMSMPSFWLGVLLILLFSQQLGWFPAGGARHGFRSFVLPAICSGFMLMALSTRQTRSSMLEVLNADFLRTARAKGVPEKNVIRKHALGNAWIPIVTTIGMSLSATLAGSAVIESVFAWPGIGRMTVEAVAARDVTTVTGTVIMTTIIYVLVQMMVDLAYAFVDPRIKAQYTKDSKKKENASLSGGKTAILTATPDAATEDFGGADANTVEMEAPAPFEQVNTEDKSQILVQSDASHAASEDAPAVPQIYNFVTRPDLYAAKKSTINAADAAGISQQYKKQSRIGQVFIGLKRNKGAMAGLFILAAMVLMLIASLFISFEAVTTPNMQARFTSPGRAYLFGTDNMGRDLFLRVIYAARYSLGIGLSATALQAFIGILLGTIAGYYGKLADEIIMRFSDTLASIPGMLLGMVLVTVLGQSVPNLILAVAVTGIPVYIRISRASILSIREKEFVEASRAIGLSNFRIMFAQVLPNGLAPIIVTFTTSLGITIIVAASLSFLGFGVPAPRPEWGALIASGREFIRVAPWLTTFPGIFIMLTVLAFNLLGDGLRDALDPKLKK